MLPSPYSLLHQFKLAQDALSEARNHLRAKYYTSSVSNSYQAVLRSAAGLLYGLNLDPKTEREIRIAFGGRFIPHDTQERFNLIFLRLEAMRERSDFDTEYLATPEEAQEALALAADFVTEAQRLQKEVLK